MGALSSPNYSSSYHHFHLNPSGASISQAQNHYKFVVRDINAFTDSVADGKLPKGFAQLEFPVQSPQEMYFMENEDFIEQRNLDEPNRRSNPFLRRSSKTPKRKKSPQKVKL